MSSLIRDVDINEVDQDTLHLLHGFIREAQNLVDPVIPDSILLIVLSFYHLSEYFASHGREMTMIDEFTVAGAPYGDRSAYGAKIIPSNSEKIYIWEVKVNHIDSNGGLICIGIVDNECDIIDDQFSTENFSLYVLESGGVGATHYKFTRVTSQILSERPFKGGDILELTLDLKQRTFIIKVNGGDRGFVFQEVRKAASLHYKLGVTMRRVKTSVTISSFRVSDCKK